ncbi:MAG: S41 family peptidase, partial [Nannocystaceae bacterium]
MATPSPTHARKSWTTPAIVTISLLAALGLTALGNPTAQADLQDSRDRMRRIPQPESVDLRVLDWALWNVSKYYVDPERVQPNRMALAALEALEETIPEVLVLPMNEGRSVKVRVGVSERVFDLTVGALWAVGPHVREVFRYITEHTTLTEETREDAEYAAVEAVLETLDPHTNLLRPDDFENMKTSTKGSFGGLGIEISTRDGLITVIRVLDGNPAERAGLQAGDRIVQINDESAVTMTVNEAVARLRGAPGTTVSIYVTRDGLRKPAKYDITRDVIKLESVTGDLLPAVNPDGSPSKVGLIQIPRNFSQTTAGELRKQLTRFEKEKVEGIVLDMRENPGGLLQAAVDVVNSFVDQGTIVATVGASASREENRADGRYKFGPVPIVVLIDESSASATEIVAGALRNLDRAVIVGRRSFGKGSVQVLHDRRLTDKELALKLTIAQYLIPGDVSIQSVGVSPDIETIPVYIGKDFSRYYGRKWIDLVREESLAKHLKNGAAQRDTTDLPPLYFLQRGSLAEKEMEPDLPDQEIPGVDIARAKEILRDGEIRIARDLVLQMDGPRRASALDTLPTFVATQRDKELSNIVTSLK